MYIWENTYKSHTHVNWPSTSLYGLNTRELIHRVERLKQKSLEIQVVNNLESLGLTHKQFCKILLESKIHYSFKTTFENHGVELSRFKYI